ncbi:MAG: glutamate synthase subunit alpha, partial [Acidimicrobiales bacterium]
MTTTSASTDAAHGRSGLYDPTFEHDACGIALVADLHGRRSHAMVDRGLTALEHLDHRGATGADAATGDGAGILVQMPDRFLRAVLAFPLPEEGAYASGLVFLPTDPDDAAKAQRRVEELAGEEGLLVAGWRDVPCEPEGLGDSAVRGMPTIRQLVVAPPETPRGPDGSVDALAVDRLAFCLRKRIEHEVPGVYLPSLSARTIVFKGMLTSHQLRQFYPDLSDERLESALALVHSRFSTNTFPSWPLAHPYRYQAHNGEINTLRGNRNWMRAREALLRSDVLRGDLERLFPICDPSGSDSASFDEVLELLHLGGRSLPHAVLMMIPEAWENHAHMDPDRRAFYRYHASLMEPWDGPAAVIFTDGTVAGGVLDRNGLRPARYWVTDDGFVVLASEVGVL